MESIEDNSHGKILVISDVHGKIKEMNTFFKWISTKEKIDFAIHLGDFWSGRNNMGDSITYDEFKEKSYFDRLKFPVFNLKGNEDIGIPDEDWISSKTWLMEEQEPFQVGPYKALPINFPVWEDENPDEKAILKHPEYNESSNFDFLFSHKPARGLIDNTLHSETHEIIKNTGSPIVREYYDKIKPSILFFGHNHYSNYIETKWGLVISLDKLIRYFKKNHLRKLYYSYGLIDPFFGELEVIWKSKSFLKYSIPERTIKFINKIDKRNL